jgi:nucleoside-diphosphate-sugar epimerase
MRVAGFCGDVASQIRRHPGWVSSDKVSELFAGSWTCSSAKARRQLGWSPAAPLAERLRETAQWYRDARWL